MLSVSKHPLGLGCFTKGSRLTVFSSSGEQVAVKPELPDDLPLLCCDFAFDRDIGLAVAGGLCASEIICAIVRPPATLGEPGDELEAAEPTKKIRIDSSICVQGSVITSAGNRGGVNALLLVPMPAQGSENQLQFGLYVGHQNGDVVRYSVHVQSEKNLVTIVGTELLLWSHRMDVRSLCRHESFLCSCSDDGSIIFGSLTAKLEVEPIQLCLDAELLSCAFSGPNLLLCAARNHSLFLVDCALAGRKMKKKMLWKAIDLPRLTKHIGVSPDGSPTIQIGENEFFVWNAENQTWNPIPIPSVAELPNAFRSVATSVLF